ncbi:MULTISPECIES: hypothetical protein [unclassified Sphingomonas]|uniref:hypothetical protein n=1 Tax=unclassified Sphingomonas TaxID=196159 RepID=UPI000835B3BE|nr:MULTISPECIES: hypothetical protein [unclassified Sphingomonas]
MTFSFRGVLADAVTLWRTDRELMWPIAGVFLFLPLLGMFILATTSGVQLPKGDDPAQTREVLNAFLLANIGWFGLIIALTEFGGLALLSLYLRRGETVGVVLLSSVQRLIPFFLIGIVVNVPIQLASYLLIVPAIYVFGRTWMMGVAFAAEPTRGAWQAMVRGFELSDKNGWKIGFFALGLALFIGASMLSIAVVILAIAAPLAGGSQSAALLVLVPIALVVTASWVFFTLVRIALYRRLGGSINGM